MTAQNKYKKTRLVQKLSKIACEYSSKKPFVTIMIMLTLLFLSVAVITVQEYLIHCRFKDSQMTQMVVEKHLRRTNLEVFPNISQMISHLNACP
jgi:hypothetical protein